MCENSLKAADDTDGRSLSLLIYRDTVELCFPPPPPIHCTVCRNSPLTFTGYILPQCYPHLHLLHLTCLVSFSAQFFSHPTSFILFGSRVFGKLQVHNSHLSRAPSLPLTQWLLYHSPPASQTSFLQTQFSWYLTPFQSISLVPTKSNTYLKSTNSNPQC